MAVACTLSMHPHFPLPTSDLPTIRVLCTIYSKLLPVRVRRDLDDHFSATVHPLWHAILALFGDGTLSSPPLQPTRDTPTPLSPKVIRNPSWFAGRGGWKCLTRICSSMHPQGLHRDSRDACFCSSASAELDEHDMLMGRSNASLLPLGGCTQLLSSISRYRSCWRFKSTYILRARCFPP